MKTKNVLFAVLIGCALALLSSCTKQHTHNPGSMSAQEITNLLQEYGVRLSLDEVTEALGSRSSCEYDTDDLLGLLAEYGVTAPDRAVGINNYFQDAAGTVATWQVYGGTRQDDGTIVTDDQAPDSVTWLLDEVDAYTSELDLRFQVYNPDGTPSDAWGDFQPSCNGAHYVSVTWWLDGDGDTETGIAWGQVNWVPDEFPTCDTYGPFDVTVMAFYDWTQGGPRIYEPYQQLTASPLEYDLNGDGSVDTDDLLAVLAGYC